MTKMKLHKNDNIEVIAGKDKGKRGEIVKVFSERGMVLVRGINMVKKAIKPRSQQEGGGISDIEAPIDVSNVMILCKKCGKTRAGFRIEDGKKTRVCKKCGEVL